MLPVIESLLEEVERNPYPKGHTSLYWQREGQRLTVSREGEDVFVRGLGFGTSGRGGIAWHTAHALERISYRRVTNRLRSYSRTLKPLWKLAKDLSMGMSYDVWKSAVILAVLADHWESHRLRPKTFAMIGDGCGILGALFRRFLPGIRMYCVDLPKALVFQAKIHSMADPDSKMTRLGDLHGESADVVFALPQEIEQIRESLDCAISIASMQEMNRFSISSYFSFLRRRSNPFSRFYCVNRLRKELPGGETVRFLQYPWDPQDEIFLDGPCSYYTHYISRCMRPSGPRLFKIRIPFVNFFDGLMWHRLVHLKAIP